jgi:hypothetical protein
MIVALAVRPPISRLLGGRPVAGRPAKRCGQLVLLVYLDGGVVLLRDLRAFMLGTARYCARMLLRRTIV